MKYFIKALVNSSKFTTPIYRSMRLQLLIYKVKFCVVTILVAIASLVVTPSVFADDEPSATLIDTLESSIAGTILYGVMMAHTDQWLVVGSPRENIDLNGNGEIDGGEVSVGAVYIYKRTVAGGVEFHSKLFGDGTSTAAVEFGPIGDRFGSGLEIMGNTLFIGAIGAPGPNLFPGQIYVYNYNVQTDSWDRTQTIRGPNPSDFQSFGVRSVNAHMELFAFGSSSEPTIAMIGAFNGVDYNDDGQQDAFDAKMYTYQRDEKSSQWRLIQTIPTPDGRANTLFADTIERAGKAGSIDRYVLVSERDPFGVGTPAQVHVYRVGPNGIVAVNGLEPIQTLFSSATDSSCTSFGSPMDTGGGIAVIGDPCADAGGYFFQGLVDVYEINNNGNNTPLVFSHSVPGMPLGDFVFFGSNTYSSDQAITTDGNIFIGGGYCEPGFGICGQLPVFKRDSMGEFAFLGYINVPVTSVVPVAMSGDSVRLIGNNEVAISVTNYEDLSGRVYLYKLEGF